MSMPLLPSAFVGGMSRTGAELIGLNAGTSVVVGALDHVAAAVGAGVGTLADVSESTGTVLASVARTREFLPREGVCIGPAQQDGEYYYLSFTNYGTGPLDAYRARHLPDLAVEAVIRLAEDAPVGALGLRAVLEPDGASRDSRFIHQNAPHEPSHCVRAILEGNAFALLRLIEALPGAKPDRIVATGGGARSDVWLQIKADLLGIEIVQVDCEEPACQGAAMFAAAAPGQRVGPGEPPDSYVRVKRRFRPDPARREEYSKLLNRTADK